MRLSWRRQKEQEQRRAGREYTICDGSGTDGDPLWDLALVWLETGGFCWVDVEG